MDAANLSNILRNWSDAFFSRYAIETILDVQRLDTTLPFQSHLRGMRSWYKNLVLQILKH